jgi:hypothetical protein
MRRLVGEDAGESLVEILVSVAVIGIAIAGTLGGVGLIGALSVGARSSRLHQDAVQAQAALRSWAEALGRPQDSSAGSGYRYVPCGWPAAAPAAAVPAGWTAQITGVQWWTGTGWTTACSTDGGLQKLTLDVSSPATGTSTGVDERLDVVIRRPCADASC